MNDIKDITETFIRMANCPEIQEQAPDHLTDDGRFRYTRFGESLYIRHGATLNEAGFSIGGTLVWLPTQRQIQKLMFGVSGDVQGQVWKLYEFVTVNRATFPAVATMNELWLAFYMKIIHNRIWAWEGDKWNWIKNILP